ncbi:MAG TPA: asparagine synthase (glutamine-hydrolyzing) [Solirubrobacteraceae bacterium]|nr:asparagine synthase (glutamine-hydrolyzing) [Solirubrobacteraceae bacterium]
MCGIVGMHETSEPQRGRAMLARLTHRGPDGQGEKAIGDAWLGHTRLSIVDLEGGSQPLTSADGRWWLVGNGEIYNHQQLRDELGSERFVSDSDNEAALHLVIEHGPYALRRLRGMYAMLMAAADGSFVAFRDPVGIKPLYWTPPQSTLGDEVLFASELVAFDPSMRPYVELFPPGHFWSPQDGLVRFARAVPDDPSHRFSPPAHPGQPTPPELLDELRDTLVTAVGRRMMADVRVGVFLSGGLDSSIIAAIAADKARERGYALPTFAVGTPDSPDLAAARLVAERLGTEHHERLYTPKELRSAVPAVVRAIESFDPSLVRSAVPNYFLSELAARHVKAVLTGEGADELFAGYEYVEDLTEEDELHRELVRTVESLHGLNLQRCDRVTMAHGLEGRVPFLDLDVIALALAIPAGWKLRSDDRPEKLILREAFQGWVPDEILWRKKAQFGDGSGAGDVLRLEPAAEERAYRQIFCEHLPGVVPDQTLTRFATA